MNITAERKADEIAETKCLLYVSGFNLKDQVCNDSTGQKLNTLNLNDRIQQSKKSVRTYFKYGSKNNYPTNFAI
jgi:hypothetical protein